MSDDDIQPAEVPCPKCGNEMVTRTCSAFGCEDGWTEPGFLYEQDPLWYDMDDSEMCAECEGHGHNRAARFAGASVICECRTLQHKLMSEMALASEFAQNVLTFAVKSDSSGNGK